MYIELQADDPRRAATFYRGLFGWEIEPVDENLPVEYWRLHTPELADIPVTRRVAGGIVQRQAPPPQPGAGTNAYVCSFEVEDFEAAAGLIERLGGKVALAKFAVPGRCWQGYFLDPEGNTFGLFEVDEAAA
ncbi:VOC family protein [Phytoactinopolyspora limicola]|uniref:VOC family protein n=1 Tax=Phytoactinopolyspora limicola TaxID=2715536 RepID=UPI00140AFB23|nr:VOC family protein [Phytoactinopolyspora limicola]